MRHPLARRLAIGATMTLILAAAVPRAARLASPAAVTVEFTEWLTPSNPPYRTIRRTRRTAWSGTGQRANVIGRLDPATGTFKEWTLPTPNSDRTVSRPTRTATSGTGNSAGLVGKLDPNRQITE
jgi:virginiamycin B lyase